MFNWLKQSNRWKHLLGGFMIGILSLADYIAAILAGIGIASALELKDKLWGGKWDWIDWILTVFGCCLGFILTLIIKNYLL